MGFHSPKVITSPCFNSLSPPTVKPKESFLGANAYSKAEKAITHFLRLVQQKGKGSNGWVTLELEPATAFAPGYLN